MYIKRRLPINFNPDHAAIFAVVEGIELPDPSFQRHSCSVIFRNGIVFNFSGVKKQSLLYNHRLKEIGGAILILKMFLIASFKIKFKIVKNAMPVASVINEWSNNYFHWLTEVLPRIYLLKTQIPAFSLLIPSNYNAEFQLTSLKLLNVPFISFESMALLKNVYLPDRQSPYSGHFNPTIIKEMVTMIKSVIDLSFDLGANIYITRRKAQLRKITNETEVIKVLKDFGFCIVEFESLSFMQQVSVAHNANLIIGIHGAGLTNIMFCNAGSCLYELSLDGAVMDKCYYTLADACDLNYYYQFCKSADFSDDCHSSDLIVDTQLLKEGLIRIISSNK